MRGIPRPSRLALWARRALDSRRDNAAMAYPTPPIGVHLEYPDQTCSDSLPVIFKGYERIEGLRIAVWEAMAPDSKPCIGVTVEHMPAFTSLQIAAPVPPGSQPGLYMRTYRDGDDD